MHFISRRTEYAMKGDEIALPEPRKLISDDDGEVAASAIRTIGRLGIKGRSAELELRSTSRSRMLASSRRWAVPSAERRVYCTPVAPPTGFSPVVEQNQASPNSRPY